MNILQSKWISFLLLPISVIYFFIIVLRNKFYDWHILRSYSIPHCKIISIGNITVGGTGKTPAVEFLARHLINKDKSVAILSRGYRRQNKGTVIVSDGKHILASHQKSGDEPYLLACNLPNVPVVVESNRVKGCQFIVNFFKPDIILLDDAFQHRRIKRDIDIVLIDATKPFINNIILPAGTLREPLRGLKRADMIWLTRVEQSMNTEHLINGTRKFTSSSIFQTNHKALYLQSIYSNKIVDLNEMNVRNVFIFSGIGNPASFKNTLKNQGARIVGETNYGDHHHYKNSDVKKINDSASEHHADLIITTEKDAINIKGLAQFELPIYYLKIELEIIDDIEQIDVLLNV